MRMTKTMREQIEHIIVNNAANARRAKAAELARDLAERVLKNVYGDDVFDRVNQLPKGWLPEVDHISVGLPEPYNSCIIDFGKPYLRVPCSADHRYLSPSSEQLQAEVIEFKKLYQITVAEYRELQRQVRATLGSISTVEKLQQQWPEAYALIPAEMLRPSQCTALGMTIEQLNEKLAAFKNGAN